MPMLFIKTIAIVSKHSTSLDTDSGYFKTKYSLYVEVSVRENPSITAASLCQEIHWERKRKKRQQRWRTSQ